MAYITIPNSIVTATNLRADKLNENFVAFTQGLSRGQKDVSVDALTVTNGIVSSDLSVTENRTVGGAKKGQRVGILLHRWSGRNFRSSDTYRVWDFDMTTTGLSRDEHAIYVNRPGSLLGLRTWIQCTSYTSASTFTIHLRVNGSIVASAGTITVNATGVYTDSAIFVRGSYPFVAGDHVSAYFDGTAGTFTSSGSILLEVVFDT